MEVNVNRFHQALQRLVDGKGHQAGQTVLDDVWPTLPLIDAGGGEHAWERDELLWSAAFAGTTAPTPAAGVFIRVVIQPQQGMMLRVDSVKVLHAAAVADCGLILGQSSTYPILPAPLATALTMAADERVGLLSGLPEVMRYDRNAGVITVSRPVGVATCPANTWTELMNAPVILTGSGFGASGASPAYLAVNAGAVNQGMSVVARGVMRPQVGPGELR